MPHYKKPIALLVTLCFTITILLAPLGPGTARAFSVGEEREVGEKLLSMVRKHFEVLDDPDITQYVNELGQRILAVAGHQYFDYHFFVINDKEFNAFAAPSGLIFIHSGLIEAMASEGELISVMAHECAHVTSRHISDRLKKSSRAGLGTMALLIAGIAMGGGALSQAVITGSMAANASMNLKFSREDEEEADRLSFKWMQALRVDPAAMESMLGKMQRISVYRSANIPAYLLTHPEPRQRMGYVQDLIMGADKAAIYRPADDFSFLRIKQRIMTMTRDPAALRPQYLRLASQGNDQKAVMAQYGLAQLALAGADYAKADTLLQGVIRAYPNRPILQTDRAVVLMQSGRLQESLTLLNAAHAAAPNEAYTTYTLAKALELANDQQRALQLFAELLPVIPNQATLYQMVGNLETRRGRGGVGHYYLGHYFWMEGDAKNAKYHLNEAIKAKFSATDQLILAKAKTLLSDIERLEKDL